MKAKSVISVLFSTGLTFLFGGLGILQFTNVEPEWVQTVKITGLGTTGLGFVLIFISLFLSLPSVLDYWRTWREWRHVRARKKLQSRYIELPVTEKVIDRICAMGLGLTGSRHPPFPLLKERWNFNRNTIKVIALAKDPTVIVGYYILYPLRKDTCSSIDAGLIPTGQDLDYRTHFTKEFRTASGVYISMLMAQEGYYGADAYIVWLLMTHIRTCRKAVCCYARPYRDDGFRLAHRHRFVEINSAYGIWRRALL